MTKFWGSRFDGDTDALADCFSFSIAYDQKLAKYDVLGSIAHAKMLGQCGIIPKKDAATLVSGLKKISKQIHQGEFAIDASAEDIHTHVQNELKALIGPAADKLHTARSRNDLIVLDMKLYCLDEVDQMVKRITSLQQAILKFAEDHKDVIVPAYTHLQAAQVVLLSHHLLAYIEMLERDKGRLIGASKRADMMPLGACALSGTTLSTDRKAVAQELGFAGVTRNSIDSVSDRDFIVEILSGLAILGMHFSRMAEDMIVWATSEFNFIQIDWALCTGSSIMPHKKNPDILELIRAETATLYGNLQQVLVLLKGLPLTYNRDLQLDKPALFASVEKVGLMVRLMEILFNGLKVNRPVLSARIQDESFFSVDLMDYLIRKGVSYRQAHDSVGKMIKECVDQGGKIVDLSEKQLKHYCAEFELDVKKLLDPQVSVKMKKSFGSTSPASVQRQINHWKKALYA